MKKYVLTLIVCLALSGCSSSVDDNFSNETEPTVQEMSTDSVIDTSYESNSSETGSYKGYACTSDCSGHEAGHQWAEDNAIAEEGECDGNSESFNEGCRSYVEETGSDSIDEEDGTVEEE